MSVYIKDMKMPDNCYECPFMFARIHCTANLHLEFNDPDYTELKQRYPGCPLIEIEESIINGG